jgi:hypothetical protein
LNKRQLISKNDKTESPVVNTKYGIAVATLRVDVDADDIKELLYKSFVELYRMYGSSTRFQVSVTANVILSANLGQPNESFSCWYGSDYSGDDERSFEDQVKYEIDHPGESRQIRDYFTEGEFETVNYT